MTRAPFFLLTVCVALAATPAAAQGICGAADEPTVTADACCCGPTTASCTIDCQEGPEASHRLAEAQAAGSLAGAGTLPVLPGVLQTNPHVMTQRIRSADSELPSPARRYLLACDLRL